MSRTSPTTRRLVWRTPGPECEFFESFDLSWVLCPFVIHWFECHSMDQVLEAAQTELDKCDLCLVVSDDTYIDLDTKWYTIEWPIDRHLLYRIPGGNVCATSSRSRNTGGWVQHWKHSWNPSFRVFVLLTHNIVYIYFEYYYNLIHFKLGFTSRAAVPPLYPQL